MKRAAPMILLTLLILCILLIPTVWWFWGRTPYITMEHPSDPILIYHTPKWNGWGSQGLKWVSDIPEAIRRANPDAEGWWHVVHRTVPASDLPPIDMENPDKAMREWEKYYIWSPLNYRMPNKEVGGDE